MKATFALLTAASMLLTVGMCLAGPPGGSPASSPAAAVASQPASRGASQPASAPGAAGDAPVVRVDGNVATRELGTVRAGSEHVVIFAIENPKDANVAIKQIRPDCECISALQPPAYLAARGATRVTARFVAPKINDVYGSELLVVTDDPQRKIIRLRVLCRVVP
jgi:hypothetical protein